MDTRPLVTAATFVTGGTLIISLLTSYGVNITSEQREIWLQIMAFTAPWLVVWWGQRRTTPLAAPIDEDGEPLTRAGDEPTLKQQRSMWPKDGGKLAEAEVSATTTTVSTPGENDVTVTAPTEESKPTQPTVGRMGLE